MSSILSKLNIPPELLPPISMRETELPKLLPVRAWVALSGGMDSCVLLHLLKNMPLNVELNALHINHQISSHANQWQDFCAELCLHYQIPFFAEKVHVQNNGRGIEDAAREERYKIFERYLAPGDVLFMAHHADDQAETFLLRLMRGAGVKGLSGMAYSRVLGAGKLIRPMLSISRKEIAYYAEQHQLNWVEDESNQHDQYSRNYLRNQVMPLLSARWPDCQAKVLQAADLCAESNTLMNELAQIDFCALDEKVERIGKSISLTKLKQLSRARRQNLLRFWLELNAWGLPELNHLDQIESQLIFGRVDAEAQVNFGDVSLRIFRQRLFTLPLNLIPKGEVTHQKIEIAVGTERLDLSANMTLSLNYLDAKNISASSVPPNALLKPSLPNLNVRFRQGGERAQPRGRAHSQTLKNLFQEYQLEPWLRDSWPLLYSNETLVAVPGLWICEGFAAEAEPAILLELMFR